jgi:hypothetical protein
MPTHIQLWFRLEEEWEPILRIPVTDLFSYSNKPLKWLRFVGSILYGDEGILRSRAGGVEINNYCIQDVDHLEPAYDFYSPSRRRIPLQEFRCLTFF